MNSETKRILRSEDTKRKGIQEREGVTLPPAPWEKEEAEGK